MTDTLAALQYYGGKSARNPLGRWIASHLPRTNLYCEPFAGMLGILLARPPSSTEIINDLDERVSNWWTIVRDRNAELTDRLRLTPYDENAYNRIQQTDWTTKDELWRAWAFTIVCDQSFGGKNAGTFRRPYYDRPTSDPYPDYLAAKVLRLRDRLANVKIFNQPAAKFLTRLANEPEAVIYCDPPYYTARDDYKERGYNVDELTEALLAQTGKVLISGYPGEWEHLNWQHLDHHRITTTARDRQVPRTERIWANYPLTATQPLWTDLT